MNKEVISNNRKDIIENFKANDVKIVIEGNCIKCTNNIMAIEGEFLYGWYVDEMSDGVIVHRDKFDYSGNNTLNYITNKENAFFTITAFVKWLQEGKEIERKGKKIADILVTEDHKVKIEKLYYEYTRVHREIRFEELEQYDFCIENKGGISYRITWEGLCFDFIINYVHNATKAAVLGTGAVFGEVKDLPIYSRATSTWIDKMPYTSIYFFDSSIYLHNSDSGKLKLNLAWGYGCRSRWVLENIAHILNLILKKMKIKNENVVFFGSSGGGTMAILLATMIHGKACCINPQLVFENNNASLKIPFKEALRNNGEANLIKSRLSVVEHFKREGYIPYIYIYINSSSAEDIKNQLIPFFEKLTDSKLNWGGNVLVKTYLMEGGHNAMPTREETLKAIESLFNQEEPININQREYKIKPFLEREKEGYSPYIDARYEEEHIERIKVEANISLNGDLIICEILQKHDKKEYEYAYKLYRNYIPIIEEGFSSLRVNSWRVEKKGKYFVTVFCRYGEAKTKYTSEFVVVEEF